MLFIIYYHILYFHMIFIYYAFHILYLSYIFRVIDTLFLVLVYLSYTFLFHILYLFIYFFSCTLYFPYTIFSYIVLSYIVILYFPIFSYCSYNCLYFHRIAVLCFSYHVFYTCHFLLGFMSAYTLEVDMRITVCTRRYYHCTIQ